MLVGKIAGWLYHGTPRITSGQMAKFARKRMAWAGFGGLILNPVLDNYFGLDTHQGRR